MLGLPIPPEAGMAAGGFVLAGAGFATGYLRGSESSDGSEFDPIEDIEGGEGFKVSGGGSSPGILSAYSRAKKRHKAVKPGMVRWHMVDSAFSEPMYVKPEREDGGTERELEYEGETYYFPEDCMVPAEGEGTPVVVHRRGESDPITLRDSWDLAIDASSLTTYLTTRVTSEAPSSGLLDGLGDWDAMTIFRYGILALIGLVLLLQTVGGGIY